jgi:ketosteroid isomerase-like protein
MHDNDKALRNGYAAMAKGDGRQLAQLLDPSAEWHIPGRSPLAGTYKGLDETFKFWKRVAELAPGGLRLKVLDVFANDDRGGVLVVGRGTRVMCGHSPRLSIAFWRLGVPLVSTRLQGAPITTQGE